MRPLILLAATAASLWSLTLEQAVDRALDASPALKKAQSSVKYAEYGELTTEAGFHPMLSAGFDWSDVDEPTAFGYTPAYSYNLTARYNLFNGFSDYNNVVSQRRRTEAAKLLYTAAEADLKINVVSAYAGVLKAAKAVETRKEALTSLERSYNDAKVRFEQGVIAKNELLLIDVDRLAAEQALVAADSHLKRMRDNLYRLMGGTLGADELLSEPGSIPEAPADFDTLLEQTYANRSELKAALKLQEASEAGYDAARGTYLPKVDLGATYLVNDKELSTALGVVQQKDYIRTSVSATWELYAGRANEAKRRTALEQANESAYDIAAMKLDLRYQLTDAYESYKTAVSALSVAERAKESAEENFRITKDRFDYGDVDTLSLLKAQANLTAAHNAYNDARYDLYTAVATLRRISGV